MSVEMPIGREVQLSNLKAGAVGGVGEQHAAKGKRPREITAVELQPSDNAPQFPPQLSGRQAVVVQGMNGNLQSQQSGQVTVVVPKEAQEIAARLLPSMQTFATAIDTAVKAHGTSGHEEALRAAMQTAVNNLVASDSGGNGSTGNVWAELTKLVTSFLNELLTITSQQANVSQAMIAASKSSTDASEATFVAFVSTSVQYLQSAISDADQQLKQYTAGLWENFDATVATALTGLVMSSVGCIAGARGYDTPVMLNHDAVLDGMDALNTKLTSLETSLQNAMPKTQEFNFAEMDNTSFDSALSSKTLDDGFYKVNMPEGNFNYYRVTNNQKVVVEAENPPIPGKLTSDTCKGVFTIKEGDDDRMRALSDADLDAMKPSGSQMTVAQAREQQQQLQSAYKAIQQLRTRLNTQGFSRNDMPQYDQSLNEISTQLAKVAPPVNTSINDQVGEVNTAITGLRTLAEKDDCTGCYIRSPQNKELLASALRQRRLQMAQLKSQGIMAFAMVFSQMVPQILNLLNQLVQGRFSTYTQNINNTLNTQQAIISQAVQLLTGEDTQTTQGLQQAGGQVSGGTNSLVSQVTQGLQQLCQLLEAAGNMG